MFGRRRHVAAVSAAPVPQLSEAQILELVHQKLAEFVGERGEWTVSRRADADTDAIFHTILARSVAVGITAAIMDAKRKLESGDPVEPGLHVAEESAGDADDVREPAAFGWEPAPITVWTDLRKPVTGELQAIVERTAA
ncbi:hypothetical protein G3T36_12945 [Diaminobutyricibacter tongyongensis]|uniref:Uncharacterized protein n=1 Tax=Leifsonia tongyongensis TaxID=1268043 RepID=A0A6L9XZD7_9MICO|nr:hypothetical protein [Diaminobutyricibacter tongyongensis]NEN06773.1 hypothetical protein [Diaminobutyricibacter tongyongensis]